MSDRKILVADYNTRELQRLKKLFQENGYEVVTVHDGKTALEKFHEELPDVVLLSAMLSKINGFDVCKQIKESPEGRNVQVILATAVYKGEKYRAKALHESKATEYLEKPIPDDNLLEIVSELFGDTRQLIKKKKVALADKEKERKDSEEAAATLDKSEEPASAETSPEEIEEKPEPSDEKAEPAIPTPAVSDSDEIDRMFQEEISATLIISDEPEKEVSDEESLDDLLSDTLSGLGIDVGSEKTVAEATPGKEEPKVAPEADLDEVDASMEATIQEIAQKPDTAELRLDELEKEITEVTKEDPGEAAVQRLLSSFDTDLEQKLSDTLSGAGLSDTSIDKVVEAHDALEEPELAPEPERPREEPIEEEGKEFGDYLLLEKIGHGGMAELYRAKKRGEEGFRKIVAIKSILPNLSDNKELVTMFIDEAKIVAQLSHQNIATIFDFGKIDDAYFISMEYIDGFDLRKILSSAKKEGVRVPHAIAAYIALQVASALDYAHHKKDFNKKNLNIVHRDVSPQNVLISNQGEVKLVDFGISKAESKIHHTVKGALKGKLLYMSPEQAWGKEVDKRSDLYSLGIVLCEMVSGKVLFEDSSEFDVLEKVRSGKMPLLENEMESIPPNLKAIINRALEIDSDKRFQDGGEMSKALHDYLNASKAVPTPKDLRAFLSRLYPDYFNLKESNVKNLTFEEFMEQDEAEKKDTGAETVLLESEELEGLEDLKTEEIPSVDEVLVEEKKEKEKEKEEIIVKAQATPVKEPVAPVTPFVVPESKKDMRKKAKKAKPKPKPKAKKPPKKPAPIAEPKAKPSKKKTVMPARKEKFAADAAPSFAAPTIEKKSSKVWLIAVAAVVVLALAVAAYMYYPWPTEGPPVEQAGELTPTPTPPTETSEAVLPGDQEEMASSEPPSEDVSQEPSTAETETPTKTEPPKEKITKAEAKPRPKPAEPTPKETPKPTPTTAKKETPVKPETKAPVKKVETVTTQPEETTPTPKTEPEKIETPVKTEPKPAEPKPEPEKKPETKVSKPTPAADSGLKMALPKVEQVQKAKTGDLVPLKDAKPPQLLKKTNPRYPSAVKMMRLKKCKLICRILISHTGDVESVRAISSIPTKAKKYLEPEAKRALMKWKYKPAEKDGVKVKVWKTVTLSFK